MRKTRQVATRVGIRWTVYLSFLLSGATALAFEVLWSRQFVTVFGNSSYAISIVLCAFMAGLGIGGLLGGRLADRFVSRHLMAYGLVQIAIAAWALGIPPALDVLREWTPRIPFFSPESLITASAWRFITSFAVLFVPAALMGATLPLLSRFCAESPDVIGPRVGLLYGLNTLGATAGCFATGFWTVGALGLSATNNVAVGINLAIGAMTILLGYRVRQQIDSSSGISKTIAEKAPQNVSRSSRKGALLLAISFFSGMLGLSCQVLWVRLISLFGSAHYTFTAVLGTYLLGIALGSLIYRIALARLGDAMRTMAWVLLAAAWVIPLFCIITVTTSHYKGSLPSLLPVTALAVLAPTIVMGMVFPLVCAAFADSVGSVGRKVGAVYAINTAGSMAGSLLPVFVLIPVLGIQSSIMLVALLYWAASLAVSKALGRNAWLMYLGVSGAGILAIVLTFVLVGPTWLCTRAFLSNQLAGGQHLEITFFREGRTGTSIITRDTLDGTRSIHINSCEEVPTYYGSMTCFKLMGALGPLLHPEPENMLMVCFGGGVAAGTAAMSPEVKSLEIVDLEQSVIEAARYYQNENNNLLSNPKVRVVVDDGRNYIMTSNRKWPVIVSDSSHPKQGDSWVLYTQEFYRTVKTHLTDEGIFIEWLPYHGLSESEYKTIVRTFQSVFPHASLWLSDGMSEKTGARECYSLMVATPKPLSMDITSLRRRLAVPAVEADLAPYGLDTVSGLMGNFVCAEDNLREWLGDGPVNTDNLPYTQYDTKLSHGSPCVESVFVRPLESAWPYFGNAGNEQEAAALKRELDSCAAAKRYFLAGSLKRALAELPDDTRLLKFVENIQASQLYLRRLTEYAWDSAPTLRYLLPYAGYTYGDVGPVLPLLKRVVELEPDDATARFDFGAALCRSGRWQEGMSEFQRGLAMKPNDAQAHKTLGTLFLEAGQPKDAVPAIRRALHLDPQDADAHYILGMALAETGRGGELIGRLQEALRLAPDYHAARAELGMALVQQGKFEEGMREFNDAMRNDPLMVFELCRMGHILLQGNKPEEAETQFLEALNVDPECIPAQRGLKEVQAQLSKVE